MKLLSQTATPLDLRLHFNFHDTYFKAFPTFIIDHSAVVSFLRCFLTRAYGYKPQGSIDALNSCQMQKHLRTPFYPAMWVLLNMPYTRDNSRMKHQWNPIFTWYNRQSPHRLKFIFGSFAYIVHTEYCSSCVWCEHPNEYQLWEWINSFEKST